MKADGELVTAKDLLCLGELRQPWHETSEESPAVLAERLKVQRWNDKQRVTEKVFGGLSPEVFHARQQWRKFLRESRRGPSMTRRLKHSPGRRRTPGPSS